MKNNLMIYELTPRYDARQSFYGKAIIKEDAKNYYLYSYCTLVASVNKHTQKTTLNKEVDEELLFSTTTLRHIKEFLYQFTSLSNLTKKQLLKFRRA